MAISTTEARNLFTKELVATFSDRVAPKSFFRSFFTENVASTRLISIEVERDSQSVAVDVLRGNDGNRNTFDRSTEKIYEPPYYFEKFELTQLDCYEDLYVNPTISSAAFGKFLKSVAAKTEGLMYKIERAYELQAAQALVDGIIQLKNGDNIDFKRKAGSIIAYNALNDWSISTVDPNVLLQQGADFIKQTGKTESPNFNVIMGSSVWTSYINNPFVKNRGLIVQYALDAIIPAQAKATGASLQGVISVGPYKMFIWTYPEVYTDPTTLVTTPYMNPKKILMLPEVTKNVLSYAAVPQLLSTGVAPMQGKFLTGEFIDNRKTSHEQFVKSAGLAVPVAVDQAFTAQVLA